VNTERRKEIERKRERVSEAKAKVQSGGFTQEASLFIWNSFCPASSFLIKIIDICVHETITWL
jgi:hypothetical protein